MDKEILKNKRDKIVTDYKSKNNYREDLKEFEHNSIESEEDLILYVTERFTKLLWTDKIQRIRIAKRCLRSNVGNWKFKKGKN